MFGMVIGAIAGNKAAKHVQGGAPRRTHRAAARRSAGSAWLGAGVQLG